MLNLSNEQFKVGMYIRLSREDGDKQESESIGNQRNIIKRCKSSRYQAGRRNFCLRRSKN